MERLPYSVIHNGMFEGHINRADFPEPRESTVLRQFRWTDLVAKLAATRELRDELAKVDGGFNAFGEARREGVDDSKPSLNHDDLSHGKTSGLSLGEAASDAAQGDRENK
ncbi:hypothetical protein [Qipengyuania qiaonensis]|uniref:Uncharacterized protein n=1 Tax=Qipengyuania qiaonensis TaxID=2867240 RepID=A0ABS7J9G6_9SPHN|nr:hypothetical protein [Qipengyuania qiaonensis]MBX7482308.1 hypothetical protein [Qipengyuania qiaonensis]